MRRFVLPLLLLLNTIVSGKTFYVATNGKDTNNGTSLATPFATWQRGINAAYPGDTVFVRGGVYYLVGNNPFVEVNPQRWPVGQGRTGTKDKPICFWAYPQDYESGNHPILDCSQAYETYGTNFSCFGLNAVEYWHIKGITVRNAFQRGNANRRPQGFGATLSANLRFENCTAYNISARGFYYESGAWNTWDGPNALWSSDTTYFINCDAYDIRDSVNCSSGDGWKCGNYYRGVLIFDGCRAWDYSDDGFDPSGAGKRVFRNCWAMSGNKYSSLCSGNIEGNGFKTSAVGVDQAGHYPQGYSFVEMTNCLAAYCIGFGFYNNLELGTDNKARYCNNTAYRNYGGFFDMPLNISSRGLEMRNNVSYNNRSSDYSQVGIYRPSIYTESNNTWKSTQQVNDWPGWIKNPTITVTDADFISLDASQLKHPRKPDGSLPDITFLKLAPGSDLIDAGIDVGLPYSGSAPDVGWVEYDSPAMGIIGAIGKTVVVSSYIASVGLDASGTISNGGPIIADHTVVDKYNDIPQQYIDEVKKMWLVYAGESHSAAIRTGLALLESINPKYQVNITESGTPESYTNSHLRASRATWGNLTSSTGWIYSYGEEDWFTSSTAINRTKAGITYCNTHSLEIAAMGFGWCWDPEINTTDEFNMYLNATEEYITHCIINNYSSKVFFTTGTVDGYTGLTGYSKHLGYELIRAHVSNGNNRILFDYADILCYDDNSEVPNTTSYNGYVYPIITTTNSLPEQTGHISNAGALRLAKAMWWMLARIAGWDGN